MKIARLCWRGKMVSAGVACAICLAVAGCGEPVTNSGAAYQGARAGKAPVRPDSNAVNDESNSDAQPSGNGTPEIAAGADSIAVATARAATSEQAEGARTQSFVVEGPAGALRVNFDDLDLLKILNMDPVTPECIEKMPAWLKALSGRKVRIRGYMKPGLLMEGIPQFVLVRDTGLCCFGPKGQVYHLIPVTLKPGDTTDYIELKPFDVVGTFRIEMVQLDDGLIFQLYHIDDAAIIRK